MTHVLKSVLSGLAVTFGSTAAFAHATLETQEAPINANYKAVMRTPHGCEGTQGADPDSGECGQATAKARVDA
jgi:uncharacterized protein YcnI